MEKKGVNDEKIIFNNINSVHPKFNECLFGSNPSRKKYNC